MEFNLEEFQPVSAETIQELGKDRKVIFLIDKSHSMIAFKGFSDFIIQNLKPERTFWFNNLFDEIEDSEYLSSDEIKILDFLKLINGKHLIIFSDCGSARRSIFLWRESKTVSFLKSCESEVGSILWINPIDKFRWNDSPAMGVSNVVRMVEYKEKVLREMK